MFDEIKGNERAKQILIRMLSAGRVPGSLLFAGEDGVGKRRFALELTRALNCRERQGFEGCGKCAICKRITSISLPPADDKDANDRIIWSDLPDVGVIRPSGRFIKVGQMREVEREANFRPFEGDARVFIIDEADRLNDASSNALLKTLEEPPPTSHIILVTSRPTALLTTIRSRCQIIRFSPVENDEIAELLSGGTRMTQADAELTARVASGSVGRALSTDISLYRQQRDEMLDLLRALTVSPDRAKLLRGSEDLNDAKRKDEYEARLNLLASLIHDVWVIGLTLDPEMAVNKDIESELLRISNVVNPATARGWLKQIESHKRGFAVNINRKAACDALLLSMAEQKQNAA
jgi:DNA polymerase III subunit delta'